MRIVPMAEEFEPPMDNYRFWNTRPEIMASPSLLVFHPPPAVLSTQILLLQAGGWPGTLADTGADAT